MPAPEGGSHHIHGRGAGKRDDHRTHCSISAGHVTTRPELNEKKQLERRRRMLYTTGPNGKSIQKYPTPDDPTCPRCRHHWKSYSAHQECRSRAGASTAEATIPALAVCGYSPWASSTQRLRQPGTPRIWQSGLFGKGEGSIPLSKFAVDCGGCHPPAKDVPNVRTSQQPCTKVTAATTSTTAV